MWPAIGAGGGEEGGINQVAKAFYRCDLGQQSYLPKIYLGSFGLLAISLQVVAFYLNGPEVVSKVDI